MTAFPHPADCHGPMTLSVFFPHTGDESRVTTRCAACGLVWHLVLTRAAGERILDRAREAGYPPRLCGTVH